MNEIVKSLSPFTATALSAGAAWLALENTSSGLAVLAVSVLVILFFAAAFDFGQSSLPKDPVNAVKLMNLSGGLHWVVSALGSAFVIIVGVKLVGGEAWSEGDKQSWAALSGGLTAFITATATAYSGDKGGERLTGRVKAAFQAAYTRLPADGSRDGSVHYFLPSSSGERWVHAENFQGASGWGTASRKRRAAGIASELKSKTSDA